jgi:hypothetical protein
LDNFSFSLCATNFSFPPSQCTKADGKVEEIAKGRDAFYLHRIKDLCIIEGIIMAERWKFISHFNDVFSLTQRKSINVFLFMLLSFPIVIYNSVRKGEKKGEKWNWREMSRRSLNLLYDGYSSIIFPVSLSFSGL